MNVDGGGHRGGVSGVLGNDSDVDGDSLSVSAGSVSDDGPRQRDVETSEPDAG